MTESLPIINNFAYAPIGICRSVIKPVQCVHVLLSFLPCYNLFFSCIVE